MPTAELLEPQAESEHQFVPPFTDPEFARKAAARSAEVRQAKLLDRVRIYHESKEVKDPAIADLEILQQLELSQEQIERTRARLNDEKCDWCEECERGGLHDRERAGLLREMRGLMELRLRLRGIGEPGRVRPVQEPARGRRQVEPIAQPIDRPASCASNTPTGCSLESQPTRSAIPSSQEPNG